VGWGIVVGVVVAASLLAGVFASYCFCILEVVVSVGFSQVAG